VNRINRLNAILLQLQTKRVVTAQEIAARFNISIRTVYRDIRAIEEGGVPIYAEAGVGYSLDKNYHLPPVHLQSDEALAMLIAGKLVHELPDDSTRLNYQSALSKIRAILPNKEKDKLERWENTIQVLPQQRPPRQENSLQSLSLIQQALLQGNVISMEYFSHYRQQLTRRMIEPIGLLYYSRQWHLIGWCQLRQAYRDFRLDRIKKLQLMEQRFSPHTRKNMTEYLQFLQETEQLQNLCVHFHRDVLPIISEYRYNMGYISEENYDSEWTKMEFLATDIDYFARWLLMFTHSARVISPLSLVDKMKKLLAELTFVNNELHTNPIV